MEKFFILIAQPGAKSRPESVHSSHVRKENSLLDTALFLAHHYVGCIALNLIKLAGCLISTEVEMELQDVSGPIKDLTMDR